MTYKQIEAAREARLWVGQIIIPTIVGIVTVATIPEVREAVAAKANAIKDKIKAKTSKT